MPIVEAKEGDRKILSKPQTDQMQIMSMALQNPIGFLVILTASSQQPDSIAIATSEHLHIMDTALQHPATFYLLAYPQNV